MSRFHPFVVCLACVVAVVACDAPPSAKNEHDPMKIAEDYFVDQLTCADIARPSTVERVRAMFDHPSADTVTAFATNPQDLATLVSIAGPEAEAAVVGIRNATLVPGLVEHGWDGVQCGEPFTLDCTAGSETIDVSCVDGKANEIALALHQCTLSGSVFDGDITLVKQDRDAHAIFHSVSMDETTTIVGDVTLKLDTQNAFEASLTTSDGGLRILDHGGPDGGLSCGEELRIDALGVSQRAGIATVDVIGDKRAVGETYGISTGDDGLKLDTKCACPLPGSSLAVDVPKPLGQDGTAHLALAYGEPTTSGACASATVTFKDWPTSCTGLGDDCAKGATEKTLSSLLTAECVALP